MIQEAHKLKQQIEQLQARLETIQNVCKHPLLTDVDVSDDIFSDPFAHDGVGFGMMEYTCPTCLAVIIK